MEVESQLPSADNKLEEQRVISTHLIKTGFQVLSYACIVLGATVAPLVLRLYFLHGGQRKWFSSWLQTAAWPLTLIPLAISYFYRRCSWSTSGCSVQQQQRPPPKLFMMTMPIFLASALFGLLLGVDDLFFAYGSAYLPVSTSSILLSTQLAFTALFAFLFVKQKFTAFSINALVLLMVGSVLLGLEGDGDRPAGETRGQYFIGFFMMVAAAALFGFLLPMVQLTYAKSEKLFCFTLVMEMLMVMCFFATAFCTIGMIINNDFQVIGREAREFGLGELKYYLVVVWAAVSCQLLWLGTVGAIFYGSALLVGVVQAALLPITGILGVVFFHEPFSGRKGVALALCLWGFISYFYGEAKFSSSTEKKVEATCSTVDAVLGHAAASDHTPVISTSSVVCNNTGGA